jgi:hypothetical protein
MIRQSVTSDFYILITIHFQLFPNSSFYLAVQELKYRFNYCLTMKDL